MIAVPACPGDNPRTPGRPASMIAVDRAVAGDRLSTAIMELGASMTRDAAALQDVVARMWLLGDRAALGRDAA
jgi:hypothetical protein